MFRRSNHTLAERRQAEEMAKRMGSYYGQNTASVPLPDGGRVTVTQRDNTAPRARNSFADVTVTDKHGRVLAKRRTRW